MPAEWAPSSEVMANIGFEGSLVSASLGKIYVAPPLDDRETRYRRFPDPTDKARHETALWHSRKARNYVHSDMSSVQSIELPIGPIDT